MEPEEQADLARRQVEIYGAEVAGLAQIAREAFTNMENPVAIIADQACGEAASLRTQTRKGGPVREVEGGTVLAVFPRDAAEKMLRLSQPQLLTYLRGDWMDPERLAVISITQDGMRLVQIDPENGSAEPPK